MTDNISSQNSIAETTCKKSEFLLLYGNFKKHKVLYFLMVPGILYFIIFHYIPMYGIIIAFKNYKLNLGIFGSEWVGFKYFDILFKSPDFFLIFRNTILLNIYSLVVNFPGPIILALLLNELRNMHFKKIVQSVVYFPHFLSWVIIGGVMFRFFSIDGYINNILVNSFGMEAIPFLTNEKHFRTLYVFSGLWKEAGWGSIIYLAAMAGINKSLYEAAIVDGANRFRQAWHITLPGITTSIVVVLILRMGTMMQTSFEHVFVLYNPLVYSVADVFSTYIYRVGIGEARFSYTTAIGIFQSVVGLLLIMASNYISKKVSEKSIW